MSAEENEKLIDVLVGKGCLKDERVISAIKAVDRAIFVPVEQKASAYEDRPLSIGMGQTISAPSMVAMMTEKLNVQEGQKVLEIGAGSGYQAAILAELVGGKGFVYTIERLDSVAAFGRKNLSSYKNVEVIVGDGTLGHKEKAPYDRIIVTAATPQVPPPLVEQLKKGGILAIPVGDTFMQEFTLVKKNEKVEQEVVCGCVFVPLVGEYGWKESD